MRRLWFAIMLLCAVAGRAGEQQFASIGDLVLDNGGVIPDCRIGYRTDGTLNAERSNALVVLTWFSGRSGDLASSIGPGRLFDTDRWFVVTIDALGNGISASPSNTAGALPQFTIRDMVRSQHALLTRELKLERVHAVAGLSMGGMQALQWAVTYPDYARNIVSITGTPRQTSYDLLLWRTQLDLLESFRDSPDDLRKAMRSVAGISMLELWTPSWIVRSRERDQVGEWMETHRQSVLTRDPHDYMSQLRAMIGHDIGEAAGAAKAIRARLMMLVALQDEMVHPAPARELARLAGAHLVTLSGDCGHLAPSCEAETVRREVHAFLSE